MNQREQNLKLLQQSKNVKFLNDWEKLKVDNVRLTRFSTFNRTAMYKILKKYDKLTGSSEKDKYMSQLDKEYFCDNKKSTTRNKRRKRLMKLLKDAGTVGMNAVKNLWNNTESQSEFADKEKSMMAFVADLHTKNDDEISIRESLFVKKKLFMKLMEHLGEEFDLIDPDAAVALDSLKFVFSRLFDHDSSVICSSQSQSSSFISKSYMHVIPQACTTSPHVSSKDSDTTGAGT